MNNNRDLLRMLDGLTNQTCPVCSHPIESRENAVIKEVTPEYIRVGCPHCKDTFVILVSPVAKRQTQNCIFMSQSI